MRLILVRHGDAYAGLHGIIAGPMGCRGLTDRGRDQARALRDHLVETKRITPDVIIASEIPRAIETAAIISTAFGEAEIPQDCDLCEVHTGEADGTDWQDYLDQFGSLDMVAEPDRLFAVGGDSWNSFHARVEGFMDRYAHEYANQTVMAVCHAGVIAASLRVRLGISDSADSADLRPTNTGLTEWHYDENSEAWTLHTFNDARHLDANGVDG